MVLIHQYNLPFSPILSLNIKRRNNKLLWNPPKETAWDLPTTYPTWHHCEECHLDFEGEYHWDCYTFPTLDKETCRWCNSYCIKPEDKYPLTATLASPSLAPLNKVVVEVRNFYVNYDYYNPFKRIIFQFFLYSLTFILARNL